MSLSLVLAGCLLAPVPMKEQPDYQKEADTTAWKWPAEKAGAQESAKRFAGDCKVEITVKEMAFNNTEVRFVCDDKVRLTLEGHAGTSFVGDKRIVWYAQYHYASSGCALIAYDLEAGKQLWKTQLKGLGPIAHTRYRNQVVVELDRDVVRVWGKESAGNYLEIVDRKTGKTLANRVYRDQTP
jgi:hypothetical protein